MVQCRKLLRTLAVPLAAGMIVGCVDQAARGAADSAASAGTSYQIFFETGDAQITGRAASIVRAVVRAAENEAVSRVTVIGKSDRVGAPADNMTLSRRRADAVRNALMSAGVPAAQIATHWTGERREAIATADDVAEQGNRVVEVTVAKVAH